MTTYSGSYQTDSSTKLREAARLLIEVADNMDRNAPAKITFYRNLPNKSVSNWSCSCMHTKDKCFALACPRNPSSKNA